MKRGSYTTKRRSDIIGGGVLRVFGWRQLPGDDGRDWRRQREYKIDGGASEIVDIKV